ncbi:MAG: hypothetical protein A3E87_08790 [Gammaproteobacteria bacterium RIFCSPHIGHO2_12_FULL_35_23]|nr:MAG: hypothetical protein A3E87_08790 [Gammaproteobacteria bacterium RIFCSPHIGHO2_12_FULL_35_23]
MRYLNISGYKFVQIDNPIILEKHFRHLANSLGIRGTILVGSEGLNISLAGEKEAVYQFIDSLYADQRFTGLKFKESWSSSIPFRRLRIRIKEEIVTMRVEGIEPAKKTGKYLPAEKLKKWLDENREFALLDTRNDYEHKIGSFNKAIDLNIENFRDFPEKVKALPDELKKKPLVMFCTGGIRCEKAAVYCLENGFEEVYQLEDGIIKYFEKCGGAHWRGECFVFDNRVAVKPDLSETEKKYCLACFEILTLEELKSDKFAFNRYCPHCYTENQSVNCMIEG